MPGRKCGKGARAVPAGADHDADGSEFVFGLDDPKLLLAGLRIDAELAACFWNASATNEDGVIDTRRTPWPAVDAAQRRCVVALDENLVAHLVRPA